MQSSSQKLSKAMAGIPEPPCTGCSHNQYCMENEKVCDGFKMYINQVGGRTGRHSGFECWRWREVNIDSWSTLEPKEGFDQEKRYEPKAEVDGPADLYRFREGADEFMPIPWVNLLPSKEVKTEVE